MHDFIKEKIIARKLNTSIDDLYTFKPIYETVRVQNLSQKDY